MCGTNLVLRVIETKQHFSSYGAISNQENSKSLKVSPLRYPRSRRTYLLSANQYGQPGAVCPLSLP